MDKIILTVIFCLMPAVVFGQTVVHVKNANEFIDAIGSDRTIIMEKGAYIVSDVDPKKRGRNYAFIKAFDGYELHIFDVNNFKIVGKGTEPDQGTGILTKPVYGDVIVFKNSTNITIENIAAGHIIEKGSCEGDVFVFESCKNVTLNKTLLFGSGIQGISASDTENLKCINSRIEGCTYHIFSLYNCRNAVFENCEFRQNETYDLIKISGSSNIHLTNCRIIDNSGDILFHIENSKDVSAVNCLIQDNVLQYFSANRALSLKNTVFKNNQFRQGKYKKFDQLALLKKYQAQAAVNLIKKHPDVVLWTACIDNDMKKYVKVDRVVYQPGKGRKEWFEVVIHGIDKNSDAVKTPIDLAYSHVIKNNVAYNIGTELQYESEPCTGPFRFYIPSIKPPPSPDQLAKLDYSNSSTYTGPVINYNWSRLSPTPDIEIKVSDRWATAISFSPDDKYVVVGGGYFEKNTDLKLIDVERAQIVFEFKGHIYHVEDVAISPDGKYMISSDQSGQVIIWNFEQRNKLYDFKAHSDWVEGVGFSHNSQYAASASRDRYIKIWDVRNGELVRRLKDPGIKASTIDFSPDNHHILVGGYGTNDEVGIWDLETAKRIRNYDLHSKSASAVRYSSQGDYFASGGDCDYEVKVVSTITQSLVQTISAIGGCVASVDFDPTGRYLAIGANWGIQVWDLKINKTVFSAKTHAFPVEGLIFSNTGRYLASVGRDGEVHIWKL